MYQKGVGKYIGIYVTGTVTVKNETIWDGKGVTLYRYPDFTDYLIKVQNGKLTLKNVTLDGNLETVSDTKHALIYLDNGILTLLDKAVLQNNDAGDTASGGAVSAGGNVTINLERGSVIQNNTAHLGGGVYAFSGTINIKEGASLMNNHAVGYFSIFQTDNPHGGAILLDNGNINMTSGLFDGNTTDGTGGAIFLNVYHRPGPELEEVVMHVTGGTFQNNVAAQEGGAIYIDCGATAYVSGGLFKNNASHGGYFGGGAIYINGGYTKYNEGYRDGILYLTNAIITRNSANTGGGIGICPTSTIKSYVSNGAAVYENSGKNSKSDIFADNVSYYGPLGPHAGTPSVDISNFMLGGGAYLWKDENGNYISNNALKGKSAFALYTDVKNGSTEAEAAQKLAKVWFIGNSAASYGGALGADGTIIIGTGSDTKDLEVEKQWYVDEEKKPAIIRYVVERQREDGQWEPVSYQIAAMDNEWKAKFTNLPSQYTYRVSEYDYKWSLDGQYELANARYSITSNETNENHWMITNTLYTSAIVSKVWDDHNNQDGKRPISITMTLSNGETVKLCANNNWTAAITNLPKYRDGKEIVYVWNESQVEGYTQSNVEKTEAITTVFTNTHKPEVMDLTIQKIWNDNENKLGIRPYLITIRVYADENLYKIIEWTGDDHWEWTYTLYDVPVYANGKKVQYRIEEDAVNGYITQIDGTKITNTSISDEPTPNEPKHPTLKKEEPKKPEQPKTERPQKPNEPGPSGVHTGISDFVSVWISLLIGAMFMLFALYKKVQE